MALRIPPSELKRLLEQTHREFVATNEVTRDAIEPALKYSARRDQEFAGFISAIFAYGKISQIQKNVNAALLPMGSEPVEWLKDSRPKLIWESVKGWKHRFNTDENLYTLLLLLRSVYRNEGSIEELVDVQKTDTAYEVLEKLVNRLTSQRLKGGSKSPAMDKSFWHMLPKPSSGSACKRLNLFLRWMVGKSEMDLSLWTKMQTKQLIMPIDVHIMRQARLLGLTTRKSADWKTAVEVTEALRKLDANDPTRFDFALCHLSINGRQLPKKRGVTAR